MSMIIRHFIGSVKYLALPNNCLRSGVPMPKKYLSKKCVSIKTQNILTMFALNDDKIVIPCNPPSRIQCSSHLCCCTHSWATFFCWGLLQKTNFLLRWWPGKAGDHPIVAKDDLGDLGGLGGEDAERVVPEPGSNHKPWEIRASKCEDWKLWSFETNCKAKVGNVYKESGGFRSWRTSTRFTLQGVKFPKSPAVDSGNEAVRLHPNLLREVVPEMPPGLLARAVRHDGQDGVHRERKVHRAWPLLRIGRGLCWCWWWGGRLSLWKRKPLLGLSSALASVALRS